MSARQGSLTVHLIGGVAIVRRRLRDAVRRVNGLLNLVGVDIESFQHVLLVIIVTSFV